jgi:hypothetical protein
MKILSLRSVSSLALRMTNGPKKRTGIVAGSLKSFVLRT